MAIRGTDSDDKAHTPARRVFTKSEGNTGWRSDCGGAGSHSSIPERWRLSETAQDESRVPTSRFAFAALVGSDPQAGPLVLQRWKGKWVS